ncbi:short-chain dehydrogenase/reductase SDR [Mizugakiibacter sediminis]|uniref:Short-chain dehydrogenase n=1 Tax=Mizugakiibacter sediminis TaxID=1475481 RepID=A0A0K8QIR0_9GAMM|nr:SDR family oxidoreductase [Mizugakiibacter sediminis]GAP64835.1 short-chain dehydrogenase/reductase SDR [Mizugakiibacter sediminis]
MRHALVTGANRGIGLAFARALLAQGAHVLACCRNPAQAAELAALREAHPQRLRVLPLALPDEAAIAALAREVEALDVRLDLLVNNAGMLVSGERFGTVTGEALRQSFAVNAAAPFLLVQALAPRLADGARVLNVSTRLASIAGVVELRTPSYAMSKAALNMATRQLAEALRPRGIAVVAVSPGWVRTDMGGSGAALAPEESVRGMLALIDRLSLDDSGRFFGHDGSAIAW